MNDSFLERARLSDEKQSRLRELLKEPAVRERLHSIAIAVGVGYGTVMKWFKALGGIPQTRAEVERYKGYEPTQEEIHEGCLRIQASWSEDEKLKRAGTMIAGPVETQKIGRVHFFNPAPSIVERAMTG